jgi:hypothetical protein
VILVRRSNGQVLFLVRENLKDVYEDTAEYGNDDDPVILCTDQCTIYDIVNKYDETESTPSSITTNTTLVMLVRTAMRSGIASVATGCEGSEISQNTTYRAT